MPKQLGCQGTRGAGGGQGREGASAAPSGGTMSAPSLRQAAGPRTRGPRNHLAARDGLVGRTVVGCCWSEGTCVAGPSATWGSWGQSSSRLDSTGGDNDLAVRRTRTRRALSAAGCSSAPPTHHGSRDAGSGLAYVDSADGETEPQGGRSDRVTQVVTVRLVREAGPPVGGVQALRLQPPATSVPCRQGLGGPVLFLSEPRGGIPTCGRPALWTGAPS